jgi:hypothetical protein
MPASSLDNYPALEFSDLCFVCNGLGSYTVPHCNRPNCKLCRGRGHWLCNTCRGLGKHKSVIVKNKLKFINHVKLNISKSNLITISLKTNRIILKILKNSNFEQIARTGKFKVMCNSYVYVFERVKSDQFRVHRRKNA